MTTPPRVVLAVLTFQRVHRITALVPLLVEQARTIDPPAEVVVVDNDPDAGARTALAGLPVTYVHEPEPGIAAARNRALHQVPDADAVVFIDDDEVPSSRWLATLVEAWQRWGCDAVAGPVVSSFESEPDRWVATCGVFDTIDRPDGMRLHGAASNNLLLDVRRLAALGLRFDPRFGLTGGEDTRLIRELVRDGGIVRWCADAVVTEAVPRERATRRWVLRRRLRTSNSWSRVMIDLAGGGHRRSAARIAITVRAAARATRAATRLAAATASRRIDQRARAEIELANACGMALGAWGRVAVEYRRPSSRRVGGRAVDDAALDASREP